MAWTDVTYSTTTWTNASYSATTWKQLEPSGFGVSPFGTPSDTDDTIKIHLRGFGDPLTPWVNHSGD